MQAKKGFTLLELAIVLVLMGVIGVAIIPSMEWVYKQELHKAAQGICLDLLTLRQQAMATGNTYTLTMNSNQNTYEMVGEEGVRAPLRSSNSPSAKAITYTREDQTPLTTISFQGDVLEVNDIPLEVINIKVEHSKSSKSIEIQWYRSGHYTISMKE